MVAHMTEPHEITTVSRRPPVGMDKPRTLADYQADLVRRFGRVPSWPELAKRENAARAKTSGVSNMARDQSAGHSPEALAKIVAASRRRGEVNMSRVVEAMTDTMTMGDLMRASGLPRQTVQKALSRALEAGLVVRGRMKNVVVWERSIAPANDAHRQAVAVTVRGQTVPSMAACARHFGISVEAVSCAAKRGTLDNIGTRRGVAAK